MIELYVQGRAATAGSLTWYGGGKVTHSSKRTKTWEDWVRWTFIQSGYNRMCLMTGPLRADLVFCFKRPKGHYKKNGELSKKGIEYSYPSWKGRYDIDKLCRAVLDALTGYVYEDDGQIMQIKAYKLWYDSEAVQSRDDIPKDTEGVLISIEEME